MEALDAGAEDFREEEDSYEIITDPESLKDVESALRNLGLPMAQAEVTMIPQTYTSLTNEKDKASLQRILDLLDESYDVQDVYTNWDEE
jgi:transcriptional/translational regulatory protein YebC/TACO1